MKLTARILVFTLVVNLLAPVPSLAQQSIGVSITQLREQIAKLEKIDLDPNTSPEVRVLNREFLRERRAQLHALVQKRVSALRQYLTAAGDALRPQERQAVEDSIRALLAEAGVAEPAAEAHSLSTGAARAGVESRAEPPAVARQVALLPPAVAVPEARAYAADSVPASNPNLHDEGDEPKKAKEKEQQVKDAGGRPVTVDLREYRVPKPVEVPNGTAVTFIMKRGPINTCVVTTKREELKVEPHPLAQFLNVVKGFTPFPVFFKDSVERTDVPEQICDIKEEPAPKLSPEAEEQIEIELAYARKLLSESIAELKDRRGSYNTLNEDVDEFTKCEGGICDEGKEVEFNAAKDNLQTKVGAALKVELPSLESAEGQMAILKKAIGGYKKSGRPTPPCPKSSDPKTPDTPCEEKKKSAEEIWLANVSERLKCLARNLELAKKHRESLLTAHADLDKFHRLLKEHEYKDYDSKRLVADRGAKVAGTITCTNFFTKQPAVEQVLSEQTASARTRTQAGQGGADEQRKPEEVTIEQVPSTVTYQSPPVGAVSAGVLFTSLDKRQVGVQTVSVGGLDDNNGTKFRSMFGETERASGQLVPFTFYNHRLFNMRKLSVNGSGGIGLNPNNGSNQVEFFYGGSFGFNNFFVQLGAHVGRWQELGGGFVIGDLLPVGSPPAAPIERRYTTRPSFGISYKLPLP